MNKEEKDSYEPGPEAAHADSRVNTESNQDTGSLVETVGDPQCGGWQGECDCGEVYITPRELNQRINEALSETESFIADSDGGFGFHLAYCRNCFDPDGNHNFVHSEGGYPEEVGRGLGVLKSNERVLDCRHSNKLFEHIRNRLSDAIDDVFDERDYLGDYEHAGVDRITTKEACLWARELKPLVDALLLREGTSSSANGTKGA